METATLEQLTQDDAAKLLAMQVGTVSGKGEFEGYALLWDVPDNYLTIMAKGSFDEVLAVCAAAGLYPPLVWGDHGQDVVGIVRLEADDKGLKVYGKINLDDERGKWAYQRISEAQYYLSFWAGADVKTRAVDEQGNTIYRKVLYVRDIAITTDPGQQLATIDVVRTRHKAEVERARQDGHARGLAAGRAEAEAAHQQQAVIAALRGWAAGIH